VTAVAIIVVIVHLTLQILMMVLLHDDAAAKLSSFGAANRAGWRG
jgi:preprotein translocase subunit SecG